jgi:O-antigen/teichoic acid export membrane protein
LSKLTLKRNLSANIVGKAITGVLSFVFIPMYIRFLGIESYGLVGLFATITALGFAVDFGLSATASRELSRLSVQPGSGQAMRDLIRTLEAGIWIIAALLGAVIIFGAPSIMRGWVEPNGLSAKTVHDAVLEMGVALALQWPVNFYSSAIIGLQQQVALNVINAGMAAIRGVGAVIVLWGISPTIEAFFAWQIAISACHVLCVSQQMWRALPSAPARARAHFGAIRQVWRFAVGMSGLTLLTVLNSQVDKVVLSQTLL